MTAGAAAMYRTAMPETEKVGQAAVTATEAENLRAGLRVTWVGVLVSGALVAFQVFAGIIANSQALIADATHSLSDLFGNVVVLFGLRWGRKVEDVDHHYGHGRIETMSGMVVGLLLIAVAIGIVWNALATIYHHEVSRPGALALWAAVAGIVSKEALYWWTLAVGKRLKSMAIIANAWHHRSDALSSVAVLIGISASYLNPAWHLADAIAALAVTYFIGRVGGKLTWAAFRELSDAAPDREILLEIAERTRATAGVRQVHDLRARQSGAQIFVELHIVVDPTISVRDGHTIARQVKRMILRDFVDVTRVIIHVDPELKEDLGAMLS